MMAADSGTICKLTKTGLTVTCAAPRSDWSTTASSAPTRDAETKPAKAKKAVSSLLTALKIFRKMKIEFGSERGSYWPKGITIPPRNPRILTPRPGGDRREEVYAACELLQALGLRSFSPSVTACPGCGRTTSSTFQELAERIQDYIREKMPEWKTEYQGVESMTLAVMGCVVNGPGESKAANIGISLPGTGEAPNCPIYIDGQHHSTLRGTYEELAAAFQGLVDDYVTTRYSRKS